MVGMRDYAPLETLVISAGADDHEAKKEDSMRRHQRHGKNRRAMESEVRARKTPEEFTWRKFRRGKEADRAGEGQEGGVGPVRVSGECWKMAGITTPGKKIEPGLGAI